MKLSAPIFRLKRRAKQISREAAIPLNEALDRVAAGEGFRNWSLLAARHTHNDRAPEILASLSDGDMLLIGARPLQGKTRLALNILAAAIRDGRSGGFFTLEYSEAQALSILKSSGIDLVAASIILDASDAICADYIIDRLGDVAPGSVIVVDYLQALDHQRDKPPLDEQIAALKTFGKARGLVFVFISQIDRRYDEVSKLSPDIGNVRLPNRLDTSLFTKACFIRDGKTTFGSVERLD